MTESMTNGGEELSSSSSLDMMSFQDGITNIFIESEELRRRILSVSPCVTNADCFQILNDIEKLLSWLYSPQLTISKNNNGRKSDENGVKAELRKNCVEKTAHLVLLALKLITNKGRSNSNSSSNNNNNNNRQGKKEPDPEEDSYRADEETDCQSAIARIAELNLILSCDGDVDVTKDETKSSINGIIDIYSSYQRQVLRQRSKPSIARLVDNRKRHKQMAGLIANSNEGVDHDDDDGNSSTCQHHIQVLTTILGQATSLIHPLMMWRSNLSPSSALHRMCTKTIEVLDEQAQSLANTVTTWFMEDSQIDSYWMQKQSGSENNANTNGKYVSSSSDIDLGELDSIVDKLAFCCQVFDRYIQLVVKENENHCSDNNNNNNNNDNNTTPTTMTILQQLHPEWTWKYASLERYLTTQQLRSALHPDNNVPVEIIVGANIEVPSFVEDGTYISTRALKRAASTRSDQAIGTVAHSVASDVWSTDSVGNSIYEALIEQKGCYNPNNEGSSSSAREGGGANDKKKANSIKGGLNSPPKSSNTNSSSFAQALLGALDDDPSLSSAPQIKSPNSGGLLENFSYTLASSVGGGDRLLEIRLQTHICALNGLRSASTACSSLVDFLDSLLVTDSNDISNSDEKDVSEEPKTTQSNGNTGGNSMVHLAREELFRFAKTYQDLLETQVVRIVTEFCGTVEDAPVYKGSTIIPVLRYYLERESYDLPDAQHLAKAEEDIRLHKILILPIHNCQLLHQFDKCDADVLRSLCQELARLLSELFLSVILSLSNPKRFTDWGSLLFSKEVRLVQNYLQTIMQRAVSAASNSHQTIHEGGHCSLTMTLTSQWDRLLQAVTILQLERPSDWLSYFESSPVLSSQELKGILSLRVDFSSEAIEKVVSSSSVIS